MKKSMYLIHFGQNAGPEGLTAGFGFDPRGHWRGLPLPAAGVGLVLDDRFLPRPPGLDRALEVLERWQGALIFDLERPPDPLLEALIRALAGRELLLPPQYAHCPHEAVLAGPYLPGQSFLPWLETQRRRWGRIALDGVPLRHRAAPGEAPVLWSGPLPERGFPCPGGLCLHHRMEDGGILFWDKRETLAARAEAAGAPVLVYGVDWELL